MPRASADFLLAERRLALDLSAGFFLFGAVLNRFLASYAALNSFTQLVVKSKQREGIWKQWPILAGEQPIL